MPLKIKYIKKSKPKHDRAGDSRKSKDLSKNAESDDDELPSAKSAHYYLCATQLYTEGSGCGLEVERIIRDISRAAAFMPNETKHYLFMAILYKHANDLSSTISCLRFVLNLDPFHFTAKRLLYDALVKHGQEIMSMGTRTNELRYFANAKSCFDDALLLEHEDARVWTFHSICCVQLGHFQVALESVNRAIHPTRVNNAELYILRAKILWALALFDQGNKDIGIAATLSPDHPEVLAYTARTYAKAEALYNMSVQAFRNQDYIEALKFVNFALLITPEDVKLHLLLAKVHRAKGDLQAAYASAQKSGELFHSNNDYNMELPEDIARQTNLIFNELALKYAGQGDYERAIALLNKAIISEKSICRGLYDVDYRYYVNRGDCFRGQNKLSQAMHDYRTSLELHPNDWDIRTRLSIAHYLKATTCFNDANYMEAEKELTEAINYNPKVSEFYSIRGKARYYIGQYIGANSDFKACLELDPTNDDVRLRLQQFEDQVDAAEDTMSGSNSTQQLQHHCAQAQHGNTIGSPLSKTRRLKKGNTVIVSSSSAKLSNSDYYAMKADDKGSSCNRKITAALPLLDPKYTTSLMLYKASDTQQRKYDAAVAEKFVTERGQIWSMFENARQLARARERPLVPDMSAALHAPMAVSAVGLKRMSEKLSKLAAKKKSPHMVLGIVTTKDDPSLKSLCATKPKFGVKGGSSIGSGSTLDDGFAAVYDGSDRRDDMSIQSIHSITNEQLSNIVISEEQLQLMAREKLAQEQAAVQKREDERKARLAEAHAARHHRHRGGKHGGRVRLHSQTDSADVSDDDSADNDSATMNDSDEEKEESKLVEMLTSHGLTDTTWVDPFAALNGDDEDEFDYNGDYPDDTAKQQKKSKQVAAESSLLLTEEEELIMLANLREQEQEIQRIYQLKRGGGGGGGGSTNSVQSSSNNSTT